MITEYRIVATRDTEDTITHEKTHIEATGVLYWAGTTHRLTTDSKEKANEMLKTAKTLCAEFDKKTQQRLARYRINGIEYRQTNIRIQTREVSEWREIEE